MKNKRECQQGVRSILGDVQKVCLWYNYVQYVAVVHLELCSCNVYVCFI